MSNPNIAPEIMHAIQGKVHNIKILGSILGAGVGFVSSSLSVAYAKGKDLFLKSKISGKEITIETIKDRREKYGRYLVEIWIEDKKGKFININDLMVSEGFAKYQKY